MAGGDDKDEDELSPFEDFDDPLDEGRAADEDEEETEEKMMPWEVDAQEAINEALVEAEWDAKKGTVTIGSEVCTSLEELEQTLLNIAETAWDGSVPFDGGERVFEMSIDPLETVEVEYAEQLKKMGWGEGYCAVCKGPCQGH